MKKESSYTFNLSDYPALEYTNIFVGNLIWLNRGLENDVATYDLVIREKHEDWGFFIFDGLERCIEAVNNFTFDEELIEVMKKMNLIDSEKTAEYYRNFKFSGDISAMKDGTIFYPGEPIVRVTAPIIEANLLTALMLNLFSYPIRITTKALRIKLASEGSKSNSTGGAVVRLPGFVQGIESMRATFLSDNFPPAPIFYRKYPEAYRKSDFVVANINHALIKSFTTEDEAFEYALDIVAPKLGQIWIMVDTYNYDQGVLKLIEKIKERPDLEKEKIMISIDSGDVERNAKYAREHLDKAELSEVGIQVYSNLDEYKIHGMVERGAPINLYVAGTEVVCLTDSPKLEAVYKMAELVKSDGSVEQKAKLAKGKESYPGKKQVYRVYEDGKMVKDVIALEDENLGEPLLEPVFEGGKQVMQPATILETKTKIWEQLGKLSDGVKKINKPDQYEIEVSEKLQGILEEVKKEHQG